MQVIVESKDFAYNARPGKSAIRIIWFGNGGYRVQIHNFLLARHKVVGLIP